MMAFEMPEHHHYWVALEQVSLLDFLLAFLPYDVSPLYVSCILQRVGNGVGLIDWITEIN